MLDQPGVPDLSLELQTLSDVFSKKNDVPFQRSQETDFMEMICQYFVYDNSKTRKGSTTKVYGPNREIGLEKKLK